MAQQLTYRAPRTETELRDLLDWIYAETKRVIQQGELPRFKGILEIAKSETVIVTAIHKLKANHGARTPGTDGKVIRDILEIDYPVVIQMVQDAMDNYKPELLRRKWIPKKPGSDKLRPLGIPAILDRIVQECLRMVLEPIMEAQFFQHSYGFRPMRDAHQALERVKHVAHTTGYCWFVEGDIKGCFDNIDHSRLLRQLWHMGIRDSRVLMVIKKMLKTGVMGKIAQTETGTQQGGILSPLLANVYLHKLDQWIVREWEQKKTQYPYSYNRGRLKALRKRSNLKPAFFVRYADDWVLITSTKSNAEKWKWRIKKYLGVDLKLELSEEKTLVTNIKKKPAHFLGFQMKNIPGKSRTGTIMLTRPDKERLKGKVSQIRQELKQLRKKNGAMVIHEINRINSIICGVGNYYRVATRVNIDLNKYAKSLKYTSAMSLKRKSGRWVPAKDVANLPARHEGRATRIQAVEHEGLLIGVTSLGFVTWDREACRPKNPDEVPFTPEGRLLFQQRTGKFRPIARADDLLSLTLSELIAKRQKPPRYNFEYCMNRAYAYNRDKGVCRVCSFYVPAEDLHIHHARPKLSLDKVNKVKELVTVHSRCHRLIHGGTIEHLHPKIQAKVRRLREKLDEVD